MLCACAGEVRPSPALFSLSISIFYVHMCGLAQDVGMGERGLCRGNSGCFWQKACAGKIRHGSKAPVYMWRL